MANLFLDTNPDPTFQSQGGGGGGGGLLNTPPPPPPPPRSIWSEIQMSLLYNWNTYSISSSLFASTNTFQDIIIIETFLYNPGPHKTPLPIIVGVIFPTSYVQKAYSFAPSPLRNVRQRFSSIKYQSWTLTNLLSLQRADIISCEFLQNWYIHCGWTTKNLNTTVIWPIGVFLNLGRG